MAFLLKTSIDINASPEKIWSILNDFERYPIWNPFIVELTGKFELGKRILVKIQPPDAKMSTFKPKVTAFEPTKKMSWLGSVLMPGIFDGEHIFELLPQSNGSTRLVQSEHFKGILLPFFKKILDNNTRRGFEAMNKKVKEIAEGNQ